MRETKPKRWQTVFLNRGHLAECTGMAIRQEHGVISETGITTGRPDKPAVDTAFNLDLFAIRPYD
jgi:hypothetical protein